MRTLTFNRIIGVGATGTVYHVELRVPRGFSRHCAVKVMKNTTPDQEHFRARMRDEARLLGMLQDEQILGVSELVRVDGRDCVLMEYVEGVDLAELVKVGKIPAKALAELGAEVAGTMHRAHIARDPKTQAPLHVIHRDVKPANIMLTSRGGVRLLDFGVARAAFGSRESQTQGLVLGTLNYVPPEVLAGAEPTPAVDVYGLGLTVWECASGKDWGSPQVHKQRFERRVEQRLAEVDGEYKPIVPVLRRLLQWSPTDRPGGDVVEKLLLTAAESCPGQSLRAWAREAVPPVLSKRQAETRKDELVGRTLTIEVSGGGSPGAVALEPLELEQVVVRKASPMDHTFNDLAPPAAVQRQAANRPEEPRTPDGPEVDTAPLEELEIDATGPVPSMVPTRQMQHPAASTWSDPVELDNRPPSGAHVVRPPPPRGTPLVVWLVVFVVVGVGGGLFAGGVVVALAVAVALLMF
jgi:serine/threonine protein kinase